MFILEIDLTSSRFSRYLSQISNDEMLIEASDRGSHSRSVRKDHDTLDFQHQVPLQDTVHLWIIDVGEDGNLELLTGGGASAETIHTGL
jgi:hypothetical protein